MDRILIKHQTGSKANQTEAFSLADFKDITFGRDSSVEVKYDPDRDDLVSRQHARITRDADNPGQFTLVDLNSRNGTFVNKSRISSPYRLHHGDRVQFGPGGPEFVFELDPPPANSAKPTRMVSDTGGGQATREIPPETRERKTGDSEPRQPGRVTSLERRIEEERYDMEDRLDREKDTIQNKLNEEKQALNAKLDQEKKALNEKLEKEKSASRWRLIYVAAGLFCVVIIISGVFVFRYMKQQDQLVDAQKTAAQAGSEIQAMQEVWTPQKIAEEYAKSTVFIESDWELVDQAGRKIYHIYVQEGKDKKGNVVLTESSSGAIPVYLPSKDEQGNDVIEPYPTFNAERGRPFSGHVEGSGFAISEQGFILTNNHVAAPWKYLDGTDLNTENGAFYDAKSRQYFLLTQKQKEVLKRWRANTSLIYKNLGALLVNEKQNKDAVVEGRHIALNVTFPKTTLPYSARMVRESNEADVALLKIDILEPLQDLPQLDNEGTVNPGEVVTVLGYPSISPKTFVEIKSKDLSNPESKRQEVPDPTLSSGWVSKVNKIDPSKRISTENIYFGEMETYQLTINSTGAGNSGGPVFNNQGQVIGLFTYLEQKDGITVSYAIPIKYGRKLIKNTSELR